jgi:hypothetical protein
MWLSSISTLRDDPEPVLGPGKAPTRGASPGLQPGGKLLQ